MPITPLPAPPNRGMDPEEFVAAADTFLAALPTFATEAQAEFDLINAPSMSDYFRDTVIVAVDAAAARTALGLTIGTNVQAYHANLAAIAGLTLAADKLIYATGAGAVALADLTSVARTLLAQTTQANMRTTGLGLGTAATADTGTGATNVPTVTQADARYLRQGKTTIPINASAMIARPTNGPSLGISESATNKVVTVTLDFDQSTDEFAQITVPMPKSWDHTAGITAQFIWSAGATGNAVWGIQALARSDDDVIDTAFGAAVTVTDGVTATTDVMISAETSAMTVGGTPAQSDLVIFQVYRDADSGSDTLAADAKLIGIRLFISLNAANDA